MTIINGTFLPDILVGTADDDVINGAGGLDIIYGGAGNDIIDGGAGDDALNGGDGNDVIYGGLGAASILSAYNGDAGNDTIYVSADGVAENINGGDGIDTLSFEQRNQGVDARLDVESLPILLDRISGIENVTGSRFADTLTGNGQSNTLNGGDGNDTLFGNAGDDILIGGRGDDILDGGSGYEALSYGVLFRGGAVTRGAGTEVTVAAGGDVGTDTLRGIEDITFRDGLLSFDPNDTWAQVVRIYDTVLQRTPDAAGLDYHTDRLASGQQTLLGLANDFLNSPEYQQATGTLSNSQFVEFVYRTALDRQADASGLSYWTSQLDSGVPRASVLVHFSESAEHRALTAPALEQGYFTTDVHYENAALLYDTALARMPDAGGLTYWAEGLKSGQQTIASEAFAFVHTAEFQAKTAGFSNAQFVDYMYQNTLDRAGDAGGRAYWTAQLDQGLTKADLLVHFAFSDEHRALLAPAIDHGIFVI